MTEHIYIALVSGIIFFIFKLLMNKKNKENANEKDIMRDSFYVAVIVGLVLFTKDTYFNKANMKTQVFTNEPSF